MFKWAKRNRKLRNPKLDFGQDAYIFRRSQTITGSGSEDVAVSSQPITRSLKTDRQKRKELVDRRAQILKMLGAVFAGVVVLVFVLANYTVRPEISFGDYNGEGDESEDYIEVIQSYYGTRPIERLGFLLQDDSLELYVLQQKNEIAAVSIKHAWYGGGVSLEMRYRQPLLVWNVDGQKYYVDRDGVAFDVNKYNEPEIVVSDRSGVSPDQIGVVASSKFMSFLGKTVSAINNYQIGKVVSVEIPGATREIDIRIDGLGYIIKIHSDRDPYEQAEDVKNAVGYLSAHGLNPEYLDVRVEHRAYYK